MAGVSERPRVSVSMVTFNHERWIEAAVKSVLQQDFFDVEVVIGDDCSTDTTLTLVEVLAKDDPRVRLLPTPDKLGPRANYMRTLLACRGEYVHQLDGDDRFSDMTKLSRQVERLDTDPTLSGVFCSATRIDEAGLEHSGPRMPTGRKPRYTLADFAWACQADSCTVLFRRSCLKGFPDWFVSAPVGDWPLHMLNLLQGDYAWIDRSMAEYRVHSKGIWAGLDAPVKLGRTLDSLALFLHHFPKERQAELARPIARRGLSIARRYARLGEVQRAAETVDWVRRHVPHGARFHELWRTKVVLASPRNSR